MPLELEALVGHLFIAGGRAIKTNPPGALCEVAPRKAARGREADTFFALVLPSGANAPVTFYEQMAVMAAERYFATTGSVTSALREVLNTLNNNLFEHNASGRKPYEANMVCAVLRADELYIARTGAAAAVLRHGSEVFTLPEVITDEEALFQPPLGVRPIPEVQMKRYSAAHGTRLLLVDANIAEIKAENVQQALSAAHIEQALDDYRMLVTNATQAMLIEFVPADVPAPVPVVVGESSKAINAELNAARATQTGEMPAAAAPAAAKPRRPSIVARLVGGIAGFFGSFFTAIGGLLGRLLGRSAESRSVRYSAGFATGVIFALPVLIVFLVVISWAAGIGETRFEACVADALAAGQLARSQDTSNPQGVLAAWEAAFLKFSECDRIREGDPQLAALRQEGQRVVDRLRNIERRPVATLARVPGANFSSVLLQGLTMYALDSTNSLVYRLQLAADGRSIVGNPQPLVAMRRGASVDGLTLGEIIDIAYDSTLDVLVAVGRNGVLLQCPPRFINECDAQQLRSSETWATPNAIQIWRGNLYLLDPGGNQLWRYQPSGGSYAGVPSEYFTGSVRPDLTDAVDFAISTAGNTAGAVYVLYANGLLTKHFGGQPDPFAFAGFPDGQELTGTTTTAMFLNDSPIDTAFFIISAASRAIYETSIAGSFIASYRASPDEALARMTDIVTDPGQRVMYVASGTDIYVVRQDG
jgi:hypothetical protein